MLSAITFLIFFQAYMVAPIIPELAHSLNSPIQPVSFVVPAYLIPYGIATLVHGLLADRLGASGIVPLALVTIGRLFPYEQRGRALGWLFGAMAGGMALGSPLGAMLVPVIGWRGLFAMAGLAGAIALIALRRYRDVIAQPSMSAPITVRQLCPGYRALISTPRGQITYAYVFLNSMFHAGIFTWLGVYLQHTFQLSSAHIGLALLGYGIPGFLLGPGIGRLADRFGRARLIPPGLLLGAGAAALLGSHTPLAFVPFIAAVLSLGYDMTQPMFAGIVTTLGGQRPGQAKGLNVFALFVGSGVGSLAFGAILRHGFAHSFVTFALVEAALAVIAARVFRHERPPARIQPDNA